MSNENQIHLIGDFRREEAVAAGTILPGMLIETTSEGKFQVHSTEGGYAERIVAEVDVLQGHVLTDNYAADSLVSANVENPGNVVRMYLGAGENVSIGTKLISAGNGALQANGNESSNVTVRQIVAVALEAKNLTASGSVATLINVRLL